MGNNIRFYWPKFIHFILPFTKGLLLINHDYQRRGVWIKRDVIKLVESVLMKLPIPEVYLWQKDTSPETGDSSYEIVDGQQRLSAILEYINNPSFQLDCKHLDDDSSSYSGKSFNELEQAEKTKIWNYKFVVRIISSEETVENIRQMFLRLNRTNLSLNPQELRNAEFNGEFIKLSEELSHLPLWEKYKVFNSNDIRRMLDIQFCSSILIFIRTGIQSETQSLINSMYDRYNDEYPEKDHDKELFTQMAEIVDMFLEKDARFAQKKPQLFTLFNIAYWFIVEGLKVESEHLDNYHRFCDYYDLDEADLESEGEQIEQYISLFRSYSVEGTSKKSHREKRYNMLKSFIDGSVYS